LHVVPRRGDKPVFKPYFLKPLKREKAASGGGRKIPERGGYHEGAERFPRRIPEIQKDTGVREH